MSSLAGGLAGLGHLRPSPSAGPPKGDAEHEHLRQGGTSTLMRSFPEGKLRRRTLKHVKRLCAPQLQLRRRLLPTEDTPPTMPRRIGTFLCNGLFQIGAGLECVFDHPRKCMQAFEATASTAPKRFRLMSLVSTWCLRGMTRCRAALAIEPGSSRSSPTMPVCAPTASRCTRLSRSPCDSPTTATCGSSVKEHRVRECQ